ncbi:MAG: BMP family ABC transporter substrate-binding protein [Candidatus Accumulibacter sp.]|jgi:basic membrane protein A|nr:BMP family ABC transporter substrate-binding protein [Accumulibacter sp.]
MAAKKFARTLLLALTLGANLLFLTGCESGKAEKNTGANTSAAVWKPGVPIAVQNIKIGVLYFGNPGSETSGFSYEHHIGIRVMQKALGLTDAQIITETDVLDANASEIEYHLRKFVSMGANLVFATTFGYMDACAKVAAEYPNVIFAHISGYKGNDTNFTNYFGAIHQARYLSGIVAGLRTKTGKIGYVAAKGTESSEVSNGLNAFAMGVESVNPAARIYVIVTKNWFDPASEALAARTLIRLGSDVISHHTDSPAPIMEAQKAGVWAVGYHSDMRREAPETVLTSAVWHWGVYYTSLVRSVINGTFTAKPYFGSMKDGLVGLAPLNEKLVAAGTDEAVEKTAARIRSGEFDVFDGVMETNDGRKIGRKGGRLSNLEIMRNVDWYYRNIVVAPFRPVESR